VRKKVSQLKSAQNESFSNSVRNLNSCIDCGKITYKTENGCVVPVNDLSSDAPASEPIYVTLVNNV
jgi:hypothetical protein